MGNFVLQDLVDAGPAMRTVSLPRGRQTLHTMPTSCGYEIRDGSGYDWDGRKRGLAPFTVLQHCIGGQGNLRYENRTTVVRPGETLLLLIPHYHRYWLDQGERWEFFWISMNGEEALRIHRSILAITGPLLRLQEKTVDQLAHCCHRLMHDGETPGAASAIAYEAAMVLYDDVFGSHPTFAQEYRALQHVLSHIEAHLDQRLSVDELAEVAGFSRAHFSRIFAASEGLPPAEFVLQKRLRRAAKLLTKTADMPVKEVSALCGFEDPNYFSKVFRRLYGTSPSDFRTSGMYASVTGPTRRDELERNLK
ncbi:AraC family transcriptional regulator [Paramesorhizobium deserti]|uniref:AraC family transcriptional regulator n=1 Tax=Paramesorhizobium deserti TaxID=1494590 RepID=A0A135HNY5_9HYPH|nr:AraC family transcriptional regulator [Paramesorhizobium deserti]KXF74928.1 AraC family transcriptional regulator [Paramesorhizobium deserti]